MQLVELNFKELNLNETIKQGKAIYTEKTARHIVASTKSFNNLVEDYQAKNQAPTSTKKADLWLDRVATEKAIETLVNSQIKDTATSEMVVDYLKKVFDGACVYYKPITRKK